MIPEKIDFLRNIVNFHEDISFHNTELNKVVHHFTSDVAAIAWKKYHTFYKNELCEHHAFEEEVIFPAILSSDAPAETKKLITVLKNEHMIMHKRSTMLFALLEENHFHVGDEALEIIRNELDELAKMSTKHAKTEEVDLLPIIRNNASAQFLIGRAYLVYNSAYKEKYRNRPEEC